MPLPPRLRRVLNQMVSGNFIWEVPSADHGVQFSEQVNRDVAVPLSAVESLVAMGYVHHVQHAATARRLDCWVPTDKGREVCARQHRRRPVARRVSSPLQSL